MLHYSLADTLNSSQKNVGLEHPRRLLKDETNIN